MICPVCQKPCSRWWDHLGKMGDEAHRGHRSHVEGLILAEYGGDVPTVQIAQTYGVGGAIVTSLWRGVHGPEAPRKRSARLRKKKPLWKKCLRCGAGFTVGKDWQKFCGQSCANRDINSRPETRRKKSDVQKGRAVPEERARKISETLSAQALGGELSAQQPEVRAKQSATKKAQGYTPHLQRITKKSHGDPEVRGRRFKSYQATLRKRYGVDNMNDIPGVRERANRGKSKAMARRIAEGGSLGSPGSFKQGVHVSPIAGDQWFHSSWEKARMETLDDLGLRWTKKHGIRIPYRDVKGRTRYYIPDFLVGVGDRLLLEEVKGYKGVNFNLKTEAAKAWCEEKGMGFQVLDSLSSCTEPPKAKKARDLGIEILSQDEMWVRLGGRK